MIIAVLFMISKIRKQIYPSTDELIKISNTHTHTHTHIHTEIYIYRLPRWG